MQLKHESVKVRDLLEKYSFIVSNYVSGDHPISPPVLFRILLRSTHPSGKILAMLLPKQVGTLRGYECATKFLFMNSTVGLYMYDCTFFSGNRVLVVFVNFVKLFVLKPHLFPKMS